MIEQFDIITGKYMPLRTDDLKPEALSFIGQVGRWMVTHWIE